MRRYTSENRAVGSPPSAEHVGAEASRGASTAASLSARAASTAASLTAAVASAWWSSDVSESASRARTSGIEAVSAAESDGAVVCTTSPASTSALIDAPQPAENSHAKAESTMLVRSAIPSIGGRLGAFSRNRRGPTDALRAKAPARRNPIGGTVSLPAMKLRLLPAMVVFVAGACSANHPTTRLAPHAPPASVVTRDAGNAFGLDATASTVDASRLDARARVLAVATAADASAPTWSGAPGSFAELMDSRRPIWWRVSGASGARCTEWVASAGTGREHGRLRARREQRCVTYDFSIAFNHDSTEELTLNGVGLNVSSRTGGHGLGRSWTPAGAVRWITADERRVQTSEGDWWLERDACEASSDTLAASAPVNAGAPSSVPEPRFMVASMDDAGPPAEVTHAVRSLLHDGATVWEPTPNGRSCRSWLVVSAGSSASLRATWRSRRGRHVLDAHFAYDPRCGEIDVSGCSTLLTHRDGTATGEGVSDVGGRYFIDRGGDGWIEIGQLRWFSSRDACERSPGRRFGALVRCPR